ncbi:MarR family winged helix-turn-helix transcriptional regulator [Nocardiopsis sp. N85]|uniref:MarR family winged helix-turn-helix transcriptional regulator n=1 Tax=Nocardiopsis sp. N85 TaxID=3029400 RepID=UPI00237EF9DC|nr:MarR family winged helix-turn-helix transcriptional regulator [Nocardiopsis sp. N85]MDE3720919.1 MarR family winged helix-turn-helix transcriptional regulator [Nocardiopsis sp. N85]
MTRPDDPSAEMLTGAALTVFRLNGLFLSVAEELAGPAGLTAARWQVLGAVINEPLPVSTIARGLGSTRQSVQRIADVLVAQGSAEYRPNPAHARAKLLAPTEEGLAALRAIDPGRRRFARTLVDELGEEGLAESLAHLRLLTEALERIESRG